MVSDQFDDNSDIQQNFTMKNNILYKKSKSQAKLCIPDILLPGLVHNIHTNLGHTSAQKTRQVFDVHYYHPGIRKASINEKSNCFTCTVLDTNQRQKLEKGTQRSHIPTKPREVISIDLIVGLPKSKDNLTTMLLISDNYSRFVNAYYLPSKEKKHINIVIKNPRSFFNVK